MALLGIPSAITVAILKYRLYQIDRILNRALVYGGLTILLRAVYLVSVPLLQLVPSPITAQPLDVAVAASTLAAAALFRPARRRIQEAVDRRFYRRRYDVTSTLDAFAAQLRHEVDLDSVARDLRGTVDKTWQPGQVSVWHARRFVSPIHPAGFQPRSRLGHALEALERCTLHAAEHSRSCRCEVASSQRSAAL